MEARRNIPSLTDQEVATIAFQLTGHRNLESRQEVKCTLLDKQKTKTRETQSSPQPKGIRTLILGRYLPTLGPGESCQPIQLRDRGGMAVLEPLKGLVLRFPRSVDWRGPYRQHDYVKSVLK